MFWFFLLIASSGLVTVFIYNSLISHKNKVDYAFGGMDALLQKRTDLVPNLVSTVKGYMKNEKATLESIVAIRSEILKRGQGDLKRFQQENILALQLSNLGVSIENYPALKANQNFLDLQAALNEVEEQLAASRRAYNAAVFDYNNALEMFPYNLLASSLGYSRKNFFETTEKTAPSTDFS